MNMIDVRDVRDELREIGERIGESADVRSVFGDPIEAHERTIVPVARIAYGFGAGYGGEGMDDDAGIEIPIGEGEPGDEDAEIDDGSADDWLGSEEDPLADLDLDPEARETLAAAMATMGGRGGGGGAVATPLGVVEITEEGTRFVRFGARRRLAVAALGGLAVGLVLGIGAARGRRRTGDAVDENRIRVPVE